MAIADKTLYAGCMDTTIMKMNLESIMQTLPSCVDDHKVSSLNILSRAEYYRGHMGYIVGRSLCAQCLISIQLELVVCCCHY
jgi:hypothetical protein